MTFLPIVERELRVTARRPAIYWTRAFIAVVAVTIGACIFLTHLGEPEKDIGPRIFLGLSILALCYCLLAGRWFTVDCLSSEKREGTLGLLFLTDLKGLDVILGKLAATSLNGFFSLLALFPVLAIPLLTGGTSNAQFWRMVLVLVVTFLFSLSLGIHGSAGHTNLRQAVASNMGLLILFTLGLPLIGLLMPLPISSPPSPSLIAWPFCFPSPIFAFVTALDPVYTFHQAGFWCSVSVIHLLTWIFTYRAAFVVPHSWQERAVVPAPAVARGKAERSFNEAQSSSRAAYRKRLLDINAFYWLAARNRRKPVQVWILLAFAGLWWFLGWSTAGQYWFDPSVAIAGSFILNGALKLWITLEAGHRLAEDKKTGAIELLLSTPITVREILRGQWLALRRQFLWPAIFVAACELASVLPSPPLDRYSNRWTLFYTIAAGLAVLVADSLTLSLVNMKRSLSSRSFARASGGAVTLILFLPWFILGIGIVGINVLDIGSGDNAPGPMFYVNVWLGLSLLFDVGFSLSAWRSLHAHFRDFAANRFSAAPIQPDS